MEIPVKTVRIPPELRKAMRDAARKDGSNESAIIRKALREYLTPKPQPEKKK